MSKLGCLLPLRNSLRQARHLSTHIGSSQNGEANAVLQDVASFEETQETLALLKILALGNQDMEAGRLKPVADAVARLRAKRATA